MALIKTQPAVIFCLYKIQEKYKRTWSWAKLKTIRKLLKQHYKISVSVRDVSYHLTFLTKNDLIRVYPRYRRDENGRCFNLPSNRQITAKGINYLKSYGIKIPTWLFNWAFKAIKPPKTIAKSNPQNPSDVFDRPARRSETAFSHISDCLHVPLPG